MKRPAGVIVSGVIAILGSLLCLLSGGLMVFVLPLTQQQSALPPGFAYLPIAMMLGLGAWGLISGIGLLGLQNWARISTLIFAGVLVSLAVIGLPFILLMPIMAPPGQELDPAMIHSMKTFMAVFYGVTGLWGAAWLVYFNRAQVKEAFRRGAPEAPPNPNPLSIRIIGWFLVTTTPFFLIVLFLPMPAAMLGGMVFTGTAANAIALAWGAITFAIGYGLLRRQRWSHMAAMIFSALLIVNTAIFWLQPGAQQRMQEMIRESAASMDARYAQQQPPMFPVGFLIVTGLLSGALPLYLLILRREKFLAAADEKGAAANPQ